MTPLHHAILKGLPTIVTVLSDAGADLEFRVLHGRRPLHVAVQFGTSPAVVGALAHAGADPNARDETGMTPLHLAGQFCGGSVPLVPALIDAGADPNARDETGMTPLHLAAQLCGESVPLVSALIDAGADPNARDENGWTPLHVAARFSKSPALVPALIDAGAELGTYDNLGWSALAIASIDNSNAKVTAELLRAHLPDGVIDDNQQIRSKGLHPATCWFRHAESWPHKMCYFMVVNEDPEHPSSPLIAFPVVRFYTGHVNPHRNPVLHLGGGGPGVPMSLEADLHDLWSTYKALVSNSRRDLYIMDPRGVGMAHPTLKCTEIFNGINDVLSKEMTQTEEENFWLSGYRACKARLDEENHDLSDYASSAVAWDVELLRRELEVEQWILFGASYGSRYALTIARNFPDSIEAMVLNGTAFPNVLVSSVEDLAEDVQRLLDLAFEWCEGKGTCDAVTLRTQFWNLVRSLDENPMVVNQLSPYLSTTLDVKRVILTGRRLLEIVWAALYDPHFFTYFPDFVDNLARGRSHILKGELDIWISLNYNDTYSDAVAAAHFCAEVYPFVDYDLVRRNAQSTGGYIGEQAGHALDWDNDYCRIWDVATADQTEAEPVKTSVPTLFM